MVLVSEEAGGGEVKEKDRNLLAKHAFVECMKNIEYKKERERIKLRDFFAGCALIMFGPPTYADPSKKLSAEDTRAIRAYKQSDAMMEEREK